MQAGEFVFGDLGETPAVVEIDFLLRPGGDSRCGVLPTHPRSDELGDEFAKLLAMAKPERVRFAKRLANCGVAGG